MRRSKFSETEVLQAIGDVSDGASVADVCGRIGIAESTFYRWRKTREPGDGTNVSEMRAENRKLRMIVATFLLGTVPLAKKT